jgi:hypothetical protein
MAGVVYGWGSAVLTVAGDRWSGLLLDGRGGTSGAARRRKKPQYRRLREGIGGT